MVSCFPTKDSTSTVNSNRLKLKPISISLKLMSSISWSPFKVNKYKVISYSILVELVIHIEGVGYSVVPSKKSKEDTEVIPKQRSFVSPIGSKVYFSIEEIDFGTLLPGKVSFIYIKCMEYFIIRIFIERYFYWKILLLEKLCSKIMDVYKCCFFF